ncbi:hypothetical protein HG530_001761 [Fusarium avenaceum]|nr:hypothetical protein HG530_001761 [Fusarium avenaceum]
MAPPPNSKVLSGITSVSNLAIFLLGRILIEPLLNESMVECTHFNTLLSPLIGRFQLCFQSIHAVICFAQFGFQVAGMFVGSFQISLQLVQAFRELGVLVIQLMVILLDMFQVALEIIYSESDLFE